MKTILTSFFLSCCVFFTPIFGLLILVGVAIFSDTIFGLYSSYRLKSPILSRKLGRIISKMFIYQGVILLFFGIDYLITNEILMTVVSINYILTKVVSLMLISVECYSIDEKIRNFNDGKGVSFYFKRLLKLAKTLKNDYNDLKS